MSTPQSIINICSGVRLDNRYEHTIYFADATAQLAYFAGKVVKTFPAYSYLRKSWPIQVEGTMEQAKTWSYLYFRNGTGKYYFYFITQVEYKNDNMVELTLELDVLQTYLEEIRTGLLPCFVERQHTESDVIGEHTIEEGLEVGELTNSSSHDITVLENLCILILASINPNYSNTGQPVQAISSMFNNVFSGLSVWAVDATKWGEWGRKLDALSTAGFIEGIVSMWMYPKSLVILGPEESWNDTSVLCKSVVGSTTLTVDSYPASWENFNLNGYYNIRNNKLRSYPYSFLYVSNNSGGSAVYRFERINQPDAGPPLLKVVGAISPDATVMIYPRQYNGVTDGNEEGLSLGNYPTCAWDSDTYKLWLAQNQNQMRVSTNSAYITMAGGALGALAGAFTLNPMAIAGGAGGFVAGLQQVNSILAQKKDMAVQPPQARGNYSSNVNMALGKQTFTIYHKTVTAEMAKVLDDYFTMYGYKLNEVRTPNIKARPAFTYVKTIGCKLAGKMCTEDVVKIENIFDKGLTWWVNGDKVADYTQHNNV